MAFALINTGSRVALSLLTDKEEAKRAYIIHNLMADQDISRCQVRLCEVEDVKNAMNYRIVKTIAEPAPRNT